MTGRPGSAGGAAAPSAPGAPGATGAPAAPARRPGGGPGMFGMGMGLPPQKSKDFGGTFRRLLGELRPEAPRIAVVLVLAVISVTLAILGPKLLGEATNVIFEGAVSTQLATQVPPGTPVDVVVAGLRAAGQDDQADLLASLGITTIGAGIDFGELARILGILTAAYLGSSLFSWGQAYIMAGVTQRTVYRLRQRVDRKLATIPLRTFDTRPRGDLLSRVTNDIDNIGQSLQQTLTQLITSLLTIVGVLIMMLTISPELALVSLLAVPASFAITILIISRSQKLFVAQWASTGALNGHVEEMHTGHAIVKAFGRQNQAIAQFDAENERLYQASYKAQAISGVIQPAMNFIANLNYVAIAVIGGLRVASGQMSLGDVVAFIQYSRQFTFPIIQVASIVNVLQSAIASAERVFELLDEAEETADPVGRPVPRAGAWRGRLRGRVLPLRAGPTAHRRSRPPGGSGPEDRHRRPDGRRQDHAREPADALLRRRRGTDPGRRRRHPRPRPRRAPAAVRDGPPGHLAVPRDHPREHRVWPRGGDRGADRRGRRGGPCRPLRAHAARRRTTRSSTTTPRTSPQVRSSSSRSPGRSSPIRRSSSSTRRRRSVDTRTEVLIQRAMQSLMEGRTTFVIAHRLSTIRDADTILVMDQGHIVEQGSHDELLRRGGFYADLYESQFGEPLAEAV